jgi:hypothetical protein
MYFQIKKFIKSKADFSKGIHSNPAQLFLVLFKSFEEYFSGSFFHLEDLICSIFCSSRFSSWTISCKFSNPEDFIALQIFACRPKLPEINNYLNFRMGVQKGFK